MINIALVLINFFFFFSSVEFWWFTVPTLGVTILYLILVSYEIRMLSETADFLSMLVGDLTRLTSSYSLALYRDIYMKNKQRKEDYIHQRQRDQRVPEGDRTNQAGR